LLTQLEKDAHLSALIAAFFRATDRLNQLASDIRSGLRPLVKKTSSNISAAGSAYCYSGVRLMSSRAGRSTLPDMPPKG